MNITVLPTVRDVAVQQLKDKIAVVIDVLRATSTIVWALNNGCKAVIPIRQIQDAVQMADRIGREVCILGGERGCNKIPEFDLSNSPLEYTSQNVADKIVIITTTNGTNAIVSTKDAHTTLIAAMINAQAVARYCAGQRKDVAIVCAGTHGRFSLDDICVAGAIINDIIKYAGNCVHMDDLAINCSYIYKSNKNNIHSFLKNTAHYKRLLELGYKHDIDFCFSKDKTDVLPLFADGMIKL